MGLEAGQFISDLVANWPLPTDRRREGDDHLRLLKSTIKNTFPNLNAAVTATPKQLNALPNASVTEHIKELQKHIVPIGTIMMWAGTDATVPVGWAICNGQVAGNYGTTPDLRTRFILGTGPNYAVKSTGGSGTVTTASAGSHEHVIDPVALTVAQMPAHSHRVYACTGTTGSSEVVAFGATGDPAFIGDQNNLPKAYSNVNGAGRTIVEASGSGSTHVHGMQPDGAHTHTVTLVPPYYVLTYIIKVMAYAPPPPL
jgi:microcystin-dependent protein